jgi:hypothetical protein
LSEVLWIFCRLKDKNKRLALRQNPHFYEKLPTEPETYEAGFRMDPIETFQHGSLKISVLVDNPDQAGWVFLETARETRAFGDVWIPNNAIIFKGSCLLCFFLSLSDTLLGVCGKLEGENTIAAAIKGIPNLWCFEEPPLSLTSQLALSPSSRNSPLIVTATQITSASGKLIQDWREPIHRMLQFRDVNIRITDKPPPSGSSFGYSATSS